MAAPDAFERAIDDALARDAAREADGEAPEREITEAEMAELENSYWAMSPDERAAARQSMSREVLKAERLPDFELPPPPDFELTDQQCMDVAALLAPYAHAGGEER